VRRGQRVADKKMSTAPENEFDLEKLFLPAWAQEPSSSKYAKYEGEVGDRRDEGRGPRGPGRGRPREARRDDGRRPESRRPRGDRRGPDRSDRRPGQAGGDRPGFRPGEPRQRREPPLPLPEINISLVPDEKGVESLARQIKMTGRAYPLFDIAQMILQKPDRHSVVFEIKKNPEGQPIQPLFVCALDDTLWLSEDEAIAHVLKKHFATFYQAERTATEPPKGKYTFVAQCGMSGVVLGPPNYHDYQNQLRKLHTERFSRMPFEVYKARVKIVRDEEVVKKWIDDQSWKTEYLCLNMPEPLRLGNMDGVEKHFRETHKENIIKPAASHTLNGAAARNLRSPDLTRLVRSVWEDQRRFPLQIATVLSQQFAGHGLQFFKVNKTITHVSVARPHYLDLEATPVSEGVKRIVDYINANPKCTRRKLVETLAPSPAAATSEEKKEPAAESTEPTPEQTAIVADLHWLIHQGHVIEFANGTLETAKKPLPKPPKPAPATPSQPVEPAQESPAPAEGVAAAASADPATSETVAAPQVVESAAADQANLDPANVPPEPVENEPGDQPPAAENKEVRVENSAAPVESPS
jgi:hypothetical protein